MKAEGRLTVASKNIWRGTKSLWKKYHFMVPLDVWKKEVKYLWGIMTNKSPLFDPMDVTKYNLWLDENRKEAHYKTLSYRPLISVLIPVYNVEGRYLEECIESVLGQSYDNFELCLVDDASTKKETLDVLRKYEENSKVRVKYRKKNGHISMATNDALKMAKGVFVAFMDNDDVLEKNALYRVVEALNTDKTMDLLYSDEDKIDKRGTRCYPYFKPDWSPDTLLSLNYICHFTVIRTSLVRKVGGFTVGLEGAQDYDLLLRVVEKTKKIYHIPEVLYHWRMIDSSTASSLKNKDYANDRGKKAIEAALKRRGLKARVEKDDVSTYYRVVYDLKEEPKVSIIIPTKDLAETTEACIRSIYKKTTYKNYEVVIVNNRSVETKTFDLFERYKKKYDNFRVIDADMEFNYSKINNYAVKRVKGDVLILLNNDTEVITPNWIEMMVGYAILPHVGAVGAKLLYPDNTVQHVGVVIGMGGVAGHSFLNEKREAVGIYGRTRVPYDVGAVTAACLCVEKKKFEEVKGLEEKGLTVAFNDIDLNMKLLDKGYYNVILPMVELYHFESKSRGTDLAPGKRERFQKEVEFMQAKWKEKLLHDKFYNPNYSLEGSFMVDRNKNS